MTLEEFEIPPIFKDIADARAALEKRFSKTNLNFPFDGRLLGDIGEAIAQEIFQLTLSRRNRQGVDGELADGTTVQVKCTATKNGAVFSQNDIGADKLIFLDLCFENMTGRVVYNGPEQFALQDPKNPQNLRLRPTYKTLVERNSQLMDKDRVPLKNKKTYL